MVGEAGFAISILETKDTRLCYAVDGYRRALDYVYSDGSVYFDAGNGQLIARDDTHAPPKAAHAASQNQNGRGLGSAMSQAEVRQMRATYYGLMSEIDAQLGRVFQFLKDTGQWDNTLIVLTSDHGEQLGDHHLLGKIGYFDQSYHIPMIVRDPGAQADGTRGTIVTQFTETIDTMPTLLDWMGLPVPRTCDGRSLLPFVHDGAAPPGWRSEVHYEFDFRDLFYSKPESALGLRMDDCSLAVTQDEHYKYVHFGAMAPLFFDLNADPGQLHNVAAQPSYAPLILKYAQKMLDWRLPSVKLLTLHSAKGLEFAWVGVAGLHLLPLRDERLEDAVRLLYVAMTRATHELVLSAHGPGAVVDRVREALVTVAR